MDVDILPSIQQRQEEVAIANIPANVSKTVAEDPPRHGEQHGGAIPEAIPSGT